jgi:hypothetical protein
MQEIFWQNVAVETKINHVKTFIVIYHFDVLHGSTLIAL